MILVLRENLPLYPVSITNRAPKSLHFKRKKLTFQKKLIKPSSQV